MSSLLRHACLRSRWYGVALAFGLPASAPAQELSYVVHKDLVYGAIGDRQLALDLYLPRDAEVPGLLVWIHGGQWRNGSKAQSTPALFAARGFAVASVEFRQSTDARFPAQVHDIKGAIRFLRANVKTHGYRADRIAIMGPSSGGHLAALVGVTNGQRELEGTVGGNLEQSSAVQGIVDYFGASNLTTIMAQSTPFGVGVRGPALALLLGKPVSEAEELARLASPVTHVDAGDPPLLLLHGDQDPQMPINQAHELEGAYESHGLDVFLDVVHGAGHGGDAFYTGEHLERVLSFLNRTIRPTS